MLNVLYVLVQASCSEDGEIWLTLNCVGLLILLSPGDDISLPEEFYTSSKIIDSLQPTIYLIDEYSGSSNIR